MAKAWDWIGLGFVCAMILGPMLFGAMRIGYDAPRAPALADSPSPGG